MLTTKHRNESVIHPTEVQSSDPLDQPACAATAALVIAHIGLTEGEAQAILATSAAAQDELDVTTKIDLIALANALPAVVVRALATDPKIDLGTDAPEFAARATRVHGRALAEEKLTGTIEALHGASRVDADVVQQTLTSVVRQIRVRAKQNPAVRTAYASVLAYHRARFPGHHATANAATPPVPSTK